MQDIADLHLLNHAGAAMLDGRRTAFLEQKGFRVLRFWDNDVLTQSEAVRESIAMALLRDAR